MNTWVQVALILAGAWAVVMVLFLIVWARMFRKFGGK